MRKKLKITALLLAGMMLLAACNGSGGSGDQNSQAGADAEITTDADGRKMIGNTYLEGLPIVKEEESFTLFCDDSGAAEDKVLYDILQEQTNIKVNLDIFPYEAAKERLSVLLNGGDYPEVVGGWLLDTKDIINMGMKDQTFLPLDQLYKDYAPKIEEILDLEGVRKTMTLPDGHIYTIPYVVGEPLTTYNPWINQAWLDKLGLTMPTTTDEFKEVLIAFRDKDPNGNGKKDEIPLTFDPDNAHIGALAGYFGIDVSGFNSPRYYTMKDGELMFAADQEAFKEFMIWFSGLAKEGLVDNASFLNDKAAWKAAGLEGKYGVAFAYDPGQFIERNRDPNRVFTDRDTDYVAMPVLKAPGVEKPTYRRQSVAAATNQLTGSPVGASVFRTQAVITDKAKNPISIVRYYDNLFQLENSLQANFGPLGQKIIKNDDGEFILLNEKNLSEEVRERYAWDKVYTQSMPKFIPPGFQPTPENKDFILWEEFEGGKRDELYEPYLGEVLPRVWMSEDKAARAAILQTDIELYMKQLLAEWGSGQVDVAGAWDAHLKRLNDLGVSELTEIFKEAIAASK